MSSVCGALHASPSALSIPRWQALVCWLCLCICPQYRCLDGCFPAANTTRRKRTRFCGWGEGCGSPSLAPPIPWLKQRAGKPQHPLALPCVGARRREEHGGAAAPHPEMCSFQWALPGYFLVGFLGFWGGGVCLFVL